MTRYFFAILTILIAACGDSTPTQPSTDSAGIDTQVAPDTAIVDTTPNPVTCRSDQCDIAEVCYDNGAANPDNACQVCTVVANATDWSNQDGSVCDDGDLCTDADTCTAGLCAGSPRACTDDNICTADVCDSATGDCAYTPNALECDDEDPCTSGSLCAEGTCQPGATPTNCDDNDPCTDDSCEAGVGCQSTPNEGGACDDGDSCTENETCVAGVCAAGKTIDCSDGDACTADGCDGEGACVHTSIADSCVDEDPCTDEGCDPAQGCVFPFNKSVCDDGNACTTKDGCTEGNCKGVIIVIDDGNPCTTDSCDAATGPANVNNALPCDDSDACTLGDTCENGGCQSGQSYLECDDNNPCTDDSCVAATGCKHANNQILCDDGSECTYGDKCYLGDCSGFNKDCDDGNPCTADSCDVATGCQSDFALTAQCRPQFIVSYPSRGATIKGTPGNLAVTVLGSVSSDAGAITKFTINGNTVNLANNGSFSHDVTVDVGTNFLVFKATDAMGTERKRVQSFQWSTHYLKPTNKASKSGVVTKALGLWIDQDTIDDGTRNYNAPKNLATLAELAIGSFDVAESIPSPAASFALGDIYVDNLTHNAPTAVLTAMSGKVRLVATIKNIKADYEADIWGPNPTGDITISQVVLQADVILGVSAHKLTATVSNVQVIVNENDLDIDGDGLFGSLVSGIASFFKGTMVDELKKSFKKSVEDEVGPMLANALNSLTLDMSFALPSLAQDGSKINLDLASDFQSVETTSSGIELVLRAGGYGADKSPWETAKHKGVPSRVGCGGGAQTLTLPGTKALEVSAADDFLNSILYGAWRGGLLEFDVPNSMLGNVDLDAFGITNLKLSVTGRLAPTVNDCNADKGLSLQVGDIQIDASLKLGGIPIDLQIFASAEIGLDVEVGSGCLTAQDDPGCATSVGCQAAVCALDDYCCDTKWDNSCANCAQGKPGFGGLDCASAAAPCGPTFGLAMGDIQFMETEINVVDDALVPAEATIQDLVEENVLPNLTGLLKSLGLLQLPIPSFDVGGMVPGVPEGTKIQVDPKTVKRMGGNTVVQGGVQ